MPFLIAAALLLASLFDPAGADAATKAPAAGSDEATKFTSRSVEEFVTSAWHGDTDTVAFYLKAGINPNVTDDNKRTALWAAASQGHLKIVQALLAKHADVNFPDKDGVTPLRAAAAQGYADIVQTLMAGGANVNT